MIGTYKGWCSSVVAEVEAFRRDHDARHYARIVEILEELPSLDAPWSEQHLTFTGWARRPFTVGALRRRNPGYRVAMVRSRRPHTGRIGRIVPYGYQVTAVGGLNLPPFVFRVGGGRRPEWSNNAVEFAHRRLEPDIPPAAPQSTSQGYLDSIVRVSPPDNDRPETWLGTFVHRHPSEAHDFAVSRFGQPYRERFAELARRFATADRWGDRFALAAEGSACEPRSDLELLAVTRPHPPLLGVPGATLVPILTRSGKIVAVTGTGDGMPVPSNTWLTVSDAMLQDGGTVTTETEFVRYEASADPINDFVSGQWFTTFGSEARPDLVLLDRRPPAEETVAEGILLGGRSDGNWYHWLAEYLPRVLAVPDHIDSGVPLIVSPRVPASGREALADLSSRDVLVADPGRTMRVGVLHVVSPPIQVLDTTRVSWDRGVSVDREPLDRLRRLWNVDQPLARPGLRLFVERRAGHRGVANEAALHAIALRHGFTSVDPSALSYAEQKDIFARADIVVGGSGAVMANYLFMRPGSRILAFTSEHLADFILPAVLAGIAGAEFRYLLGRSTLGLDEVEDRNMWNHADYVIDPADLDEALGLFD